MKSTYKNKKVLLLGANKRALFCWAKELKKTGFSVEIADSEEIPLQYSKFVYKYHKIKTRDNDISFFFNSLKNIISNNQYDFLIPVNDFALELIHIFRKDLLKLTDIKACPLPEQFNYSSNKYKLYNLCVKHDIPTPFSQKIESVFDIERVDIDEVKLPLVIKPVFSKKIINNELKSFSAKHIISKSELNKLKQDLDFSVPWLIQEYIAGSEIAYNFLADKGKVVDYYFDKHVYGSFGEESVCRQTIPPIAEVKNQMDFLIEKISWSGPGMFDIILKDNKAYILELNGRLWAAAKLGVEAGCNIPANYINNRILNKKSLTEHFYNSKLSMINKELSIKHLINKNSTKNKLYLLLMILKEFFKSRKYVLVEDRLTYDWKFCIANYWKLFRKILIK